jgi:Lon protease-like protein
MMKHGHGSAPHSDGQIVVPVFPLPNVYLFPGCVMPLHIFEPRYRAMIDDLLDRPGRMVMGTVLEGRVDGDGNPAVLGIGGLGEIGRHERLPDGRYLIWLVGLGRVRIEEVESPKPYRQVRVEPLRETEVANEREPALRKRVQKALALRCPDFPKLPPDLPLTHLVDLLTQKIQMNSSVMQELFCETNLERRAERVLSEHACHPIAPAPAPDQGGGSDSGPSISGS